MNTSGARPAGRNLLATMLLATALLAPVLLAGCGLFGRGTAPPAAAGPGQQAAPNPDDPFAGGVLNAIATQAPAGSVSQYLAQLAGQFGWEDQVAQNAPLKQAVLDEAFDERVEPFLLALYYRNGFSVLPTVGEDHEFARDTVVRGEVSATRVLVTERKPVRLIFLRRLDNVQVVYPQDGTQPQLFVIDARSVVAVRQSLLKQYLR